MTVTLVCSALSIPICPQTQPQPQPTWGALIDMPDLKDRFMLVTKALLSRVTRVFIR